MKKIIYVDMDGVLVDFESGINKLSPEIKQEYAGRYDEVEGIFALMEPMQNAIEALHKLAEKYDLYILSTAPWDNLSAPTDKLKWIKKYFGSGPESLFYKRVILSHHKDLNCGDYLIDDRLKNGAEKFTGEHIHFASENFPDWQAVLDYLM